MDFSDWENLLRSLEQFIWTRSDLNSERLEQFLKKSGFLLIPGGIPSNNYDSN